MESESDSPVHHQQRSAFIRNLVQRSSVPQATRSDARCVPSSIVQFWDDLAKLPEDVRECIATWSRWKTSGFVHRVFDTESAAQFIGRSFGPDHARAFTRCYHPAMQADYFRLCYLFVEGGMYVDADDVCMARDISSLFDGSSLKVQPLCYDIESDSMVSPRDFLQAGANDDGWIFYFNNNPLVACPRDPIIRRALERATQLLNDAADGELPEIQSTTGPGNLSRAVFELGAASEGNDQIQVLKGWDSIAVSRWPLSYRRDTRNWRLSNGKSFHAACRSFNESI
ncbi:glycosyltransferase family 32 protein [Variovorax gossypii]